MDEQLHRHQSLCSQPTGMNGTASSAPYYPEYNQQISLYGKRSDPSQRKEGGINSLLFHLVTALQMCLLRIEDADAILSGDPDAARKRSECLVDELCAKEFVLSRDLFRGTHMHTKGNCLINSTKSINDCNINDQVLLHVKLPQQQPMAENERKMRLSLLRGRIAWYGSLGLGCAVGTYKYVGRLETSQQKKIVRVVAKLTASMFIAIFLKKNFLRLQVRARLLDSASILRVWQQKWILASSVVQQNNMRKEVSYDRLIAEPSAEDHDRDLKAASRHLLECVPLQSNKGAFWYSQGALRFLLVRRAMDLIYASVGTAVEYTGPEGSFGMWMPIAAAAASYYAIAGADATSSRAAQVLASPSSDLIKRAWGTISLPSVKRLSLDVSRILKGAAVAEKIQICGINCFVLSQAPFPALSAALKRYKRQKERKMVARLSTIEEILDDDSQEDRSPRQRRSSSSSQTAYETKDVIFHLTGGGWFSHTHAGDFSYLMSWSSATYAVIICPEYALLPEYTFPTAINQVCEVYCALLSEDTDSLLGFRTGAIIVTGESAGGNLAAALCVKLYCDRLVPVCSPVENCENIIEYDDFTQDYHNAKFHQREHTPGISLSKSDAQDIVDGNFPVSLSKARMPDAMMLSCPALNLCLSPSPSRIMGVGDPVLPTGLLYSISKAYLPESCGISRSDPIVSPYFAPDCILRLFPPTLLYASSADPLLDDAVDFNTRLRRVGVESDLRSVPHMPHAFWGLGSAGFPEAKQVHRECQRWLKEHFQRFHFNTSCDEAA